MAATTIQYDVFRLRTVTYCENLLINLMYVSKSEYRLYLEVNYTVLFFIWVFSHKHFQFAGQQGRGNAIAISLTPLYHFYLLGISWVITAGRSLLHITSSRS